MMNTLGARFWDIIDQTVDEDEDRQTEALENELKNLTPEELLAFERDFFAASLAAYRWDLWGAAYVINGGCSDDGFIDFRSWLIAQGKVVYDAALADPESLADHIRSDFAMFEEFAYVAIRVYEERTDGDFPPPEGAYPSQPEGVRWEENDLAALFPKLTKKVESFE